MASTQVATEYPCWTESNLQKETTLNEDEYPSLTTEPVQKTPKTPTKTPQKSTTTRPKNQRERREAVLSEAETELLQNCFANNSYVENRKATEKKERASAVRRQQALHALSDKEKLKERLEKTRMCRSVADNAVCPHGTNCRFAHSEEELVIPVCLFDRDCRYVEFCENGGVKNRGSRPCKQKHTGENKAQYMQRINQLSSKSRKASSPPSAAAPMIPRQLQLNKAPEVSKEAVLPEKTLVSEEAQVCEDPETVLIVPFDLAPAAMEAAIKAGNRRIRVEIVNRPEVGQYGSDCGRC